MNEEKYKRKRIKCIAYKISPYTVAGCDEDLATAIFNLVEEENARLKDKIDKAIKYLYEHSEYNDEYGIHYIDEDEYCVDYLLDILKEN